MKTFKLDENGDLVIDDNKIVYVKGIDIIVQTLKQVLGTNLGEWFGDTDEGIDYSVILTKNPNYDLIHDTITTAVNKVADSLNTKLDIENISYSVSGRDLTVTFLLTITDTGESTAVEVTL